MQTAIIHKSFPFTGSYTVILDESESNKEAVTAVPLLPFKGTDGSSAVRFVYECGTKVLVTKIDSGEYCILGCLPTSTERPASDGSKRVSEAGFSISKKSTDLSSYIGSTIYRHIGEADYTGFEDQDLIPGDISMTAGGGAHLKILRGGLGVLSSDTAKVQVNKADGSVRLDSVRYSSKTAMGEFSVEDTPSGAFEMKYRGNTDPAATNPNVEFNISSEGENPQLDLRLGDFGVSISSSGDMILRASRVFIDDGTTISQLETSITENAASINSEFDDILVSTKANSTSKTLGNSKTITGGEAHDSAGDKRVVTTIGPSPAKNPLLTVAPDSVISRTDIIASGSQSVSIGSTTSGGGSYHLDSFGGDIKLSAKTAVSPLVGGSVTLSSTSQAGRSSGAFGAVIDAKRTIIGGGFGLNSPGTPSAQALNLPIPGGLNPTMSGACKFNALFTYMKVLHVMLDKHVHAVPSMVIPPIPVPTATPNNPAVPAVTTAGATSAGVTLPSPVFTATLTPLALAVESQSTWLLGT